MTCDLSKILKGKVVVVGIGNPIRGDDGFGPALIERLTGKVKAVLIDVGIAPESYGGRIIRENPDTILLVDAVHLERGVGEYEILHKDDIVKSGFTTHDLSPKMFIEYLEGQVKADIYMLGLQPERLSIGDELSEPVEEAINDLEKQFVEVIGA